MHSFILVGERSRPTAMLAYYSQKQEKKQQHTELRMVSDSHTFRQPFPQWNLRHKYVRWQIVFFTKWIKVAQVHS